MNNTSNFDITEVCRITRILNTNRRNVQACCYSIRGLYNDILQSEWDGLSRMNFHRIMFGEDNETGIIGEMLGICLVMNNLLYNFACYVSNVYNEQKGAKYYSYKNFVDDSVKINKINVEKLYQNLNPDRVATPKDNFVSLNYYIREYLNEGIKVNIDNFNQYLAELKQVGIMDETTSDINIQVQKLNQKTAEVEQTLSRLLSELEGFGQTAQAEVNKTVAAQESVINPEN